MQDFEAKDIKPMNSDILVEHVNENHVLNQESSLILDATKSDQTSTHVFLVHRVGKDVTQVKEGEHIIVRWVDMTPAFILSDLEPNRKFAITDESKVLAVVDE